MQAVNTDRTLVPQKSTSKYIFIILIFSALIAALLLYLSSVYKTFLPASLPKGTVVISQSTLEEKYGSAHEPCRLDSSRWHGGCPLENCGW